MEKGHFKFSYFPLNVRGAITRAILSAAKADWENKVITFEDWPKIKSSGLCEFNQLPVLEHGDKKLTQSMAIELYVSRIFNLMGKTPDDEYQIISLLCTYEDIYLLSHEIVLPSSEEMKKKKEELFTQVIEKYTFYLKQIEKRYIAHGKGKYFLGDYFSLADIYLTVVINCYCQLLKDKCPTKTAAPELFALMVRIKGGELKEYFDKYFFEGF